MSKPYIREYARGPSHELKTLNQHSTQIDVASVVSNVQSVFHNYHFREVISPAYKNNWLDSLQGPYKTNEAKRLWCEDWENWTPEDFLEHIVLVFRDKKTSSDKSVLERIGGITLEFDLFNPLVADVIL